MLLEKQIERKVGKYVQKLGWLCHKVRFAENGWPDRLYIGPTGFHVWIEFKRPGEKPDPLQIDRIETLLIRGVKAGWTDNYDDAIYFINPMDSEILPAQGYKIAFRAGICGPTPGSRPWKDIYRTGCFDGSLPKEADPTVPTHLANQTDVPSVAKRDSEMDGLLPPHYVDPSRFD